MRPSLFFIGDNRDSMNWGRGASIALRRLLDSEFEIPGSVTAESFDLNTAEAGYIGTLMPNRYYHHFRYLLTRRNRRSIGWYLTLEEFFGARDFIDEDPAVSVNNLLAHKQRNPELARIFNRVSNSDLLVIDGDGDIVFSTPPRRSALFFLAMMELGNRLGKPVFLVNSMISDCPQTGRNRNTMASYKQLLGNCTAVALRDPESLEYVQKEMPEAKSSLIPDSLFSWFPIYDNGVRPPANGNCLLPFPERKEYWDRLDFSEPYICIGGGALASHHPDQAEKSYGQIVDAIRTLGYRVILTENDSPDSYLQRVATEKGIGIIPATTSILMCGAVTAQARLFISGRYHPSIFASLGGTPCIFLGTHSHKTGSLARVLEYSIQRQFSALPSGSEIDEIVSLAQNYLRQGETLRSRIRSVAKLRCDEANRLPAFLKRHMNG